MSVLFEPMKIQGLRLNNRFVRSATNDNCSNEKGEITDKTLQLFTGLAQGNIGLIITGYAYVHRTGQSFRRMTAIDRDEYISGLKKLADTVHRHHGKIALQLAHCGRNSYIVRERGKIPLAPSKVEDDPYFNLSHRTMTEVEIEELIRAFGQGARRAREAGFDAVQLHGAHSYLFAQFLSPRSNRRTDIWGGNPENRMRFHLEVIKAIRKEVGGDYPLLIKLGVQDTGEGGMTLEEGITTAQKLVAGTVDAIEVSEGMEESPAHHIRRGVKPGENEAYYAPWAKEVKKAVTVPVILVGGMRSFDVMEQIVNERGTDAISMCRPFIREPGILWRWQSGNREPAQCLSCNNCLGMVRGEEPLQCMRTSE